MSPTILIAGATGNTGRNTTETLSRFIDSKSFLSGYKILALTRSANGDAAKQLSKLPNVEVVEMAWTEVTADWLRKNNVVRAFIASHVLPTQFSEESTFHVAALKAGVKYVVRISTTAANVRPDSLAYYSRTHWAIESLLASPEFSAMQWTSLQPNAFTPLFLNTGVQFVKDFRETGKQGILRLMSNEDAPVAPIDANEVGAIAAHLLAEEDPSRHNKAKYVLNGPEDITGKQVVELVEQAIGTKVENVVYKDTSFIDHMVMAAPSEFQSIMKSIVHSLDASWEGKCSTSTTSKEMLELDLLKLTPAEAFKAFIQ
ncbi:NmrA domain-containing protein [Fusarium keratoplasticum]|uniref:NmrA domain-containing protein n=1 Tax=Fusarium keratoplasticum TaxID=1328300 RepID=A0ACC0QHR0_9HYPO|nr:NmrA domain-containing protein [Fusarium keratoplasticum]KAI8654530.1 NmrA domain-containing protein [Fusarium keratoplasticum]